MLLLNGAANRDDRHFTDPDRFDVHRDGGRASPSATGSTSASVPPGPAEGRVALEEILRRWRVWEVDGEQGQMAHTASVRGWGYLPVPPRLSRLNATARGADQQGGGAPRAETAQHLSKLNCRGSTKFPSNPLLVASGSHL